MKINISSKILLLSTWIIFSACSENSTNQKIVNLNLKDSLPQVAHTSKRIQQPISTINLLNKVYKIGAENHLKGCEFQFACDCCSGNLIFLEDSTYYYVTFCLADITVTRGKYSVIGDSLQLESSQNQVKEEYNWARESDSTAQEFFIKDTKISPYTFTFTLFECEKKHILIDKNENGTWIAAPSELTPREELKLLEQKGILERFKN